jgi:hypothetical protein
VDDGSTDESHDIISKFEGRITPLYRDHKGQCAALNAGFSVSRGDVVIFLDSDDCLLSDAVERFVRPFKENTALTNSQGFMIAVDAKGNSLGRMIPPRLSPSGEYKEAILKKGPWVCWKAWTSGNAWARWFLEQVFPLPEDIENRVFPDGCLNPLAALYGPIVTLDKPVAYYRIHESNIGPINTEFSVSSLSKRLTIMQHSYEFIAQRATELGLEPPLERWLKWRGAWRPNLMDYAISLMNPSRKPPRFHEVALGPFVEGGTNGLKATALVVALTIVWFSPRKPALWMIQRLLQIPKPRKIQPTDSHEH